jgi:hypothetical protein
MPFDLWLAISMMAVSRKEIPGGKAHGGIPPRSAIPGWSTGPQSGMPDHRNVRGALGSLGNAAGFAPGFALGRLPRVRFVSAMALLRQLSSRLTESSLALQTMFGVWWSW